MITPNSLIFRYLRSCLFGLMAMALTGRSLHAGEPASYSQYFDSEKGFKPAQANFQLIALQMAGSFEQAGTPEPWIRHVMAENKRIDEKYSRATGKPGSVRPDYLTDEYLEKLLRNWNRMAPVLALENLTRQSGRNLRYAIMGSWNMAPVEICATQTNLTTEESNTFRSLLQKEFFTKSDFPAMESFYSTAFDKLNEEGKAQISKRTSWGQLSPDQRDAAIANNKGGTILLGILKEHQKQTVAFLEDRNSFRADAESLKKELHAKLKLGQNSLTLTGLPETERDALIYSHAIWEGFQKRLDQIRKQAKQPGQAQTLENYLLGMAAEILVVAQMEFQLALNEGWANRIPGSN